MKTPRLTAMLLMCLGAASISCGGGGGSTTPTPAPPVLAQLTITTASILPPTLQAHSYSTTLAAANGQGALHWSIARIAPTTLFVDGLTMDPNTGTLSGTPTFAGTAGFIATVTDSASPARSASANFNVTAYSVLASANPQTATVTEFQTPFIVRAGITGGFPPVAFSVSSGTMPPGLKFDSSGQLTGAAYAQGTYQFTLTAHDSFSPPETATQPFTIQVNAPALSVASTIPARLSVNRPFSGKVLAIGGVPPYFFSQPFTGISPPGLSFDTTTGILSGTPTTATSFGGSVNVTDSSSPPQRGFAFLNFSIGPPLGRNDTPATATLIGNGSYSGSISPYIDPPNGAPFAGDSDYYKLISLGGVTVHVETTAKRGNPNNPLDTVIEIVDGNGIRLNSCRQPGDTSTSFAGSCINDDISASPHVQDSALDFKVPVATNLSSAFYVHVFDFRGDARPDMTYFLQVTGTVAAMVINPTPLPAAARGLSYSQQLFSTNGSGAVSWSIVGGSLPPGLTLNPTGLFSGPASTDGTYSFTVQAADSATPPQTATLQEQIQVGEPLKITSAAAWPDACLNKPYSFTVQTSGGVPPLQYETNGGPWPIFNIDQSTGTYSGTPSFLGNFNVEVVVNDATVIHGDFQPVTLTVKQCP